MAYSTPYYQPVQNKRVSTKNHRLATKGGSMRAPRAAEGGPDNFLSDLDYNAILSGVGQGLSAYGQGQADTYDFSVDPHAGYKGSFQGFTSGGAAGAVIGGVTGQLGTFSEVNKNLKALDTGVNLTGHSATGQPVYMGGAFLDSGEKLDALDEGEDSAKMFYEGGDSYDPATAIFNELFGTTDKISRKRNELVTKRYGAQQNFNKSRERFEKQQRTFDDYQQRLNINDQLYNLYR